MLGLLGHLDHSTSHQSQAVYCDERRMEQKDESKRMHVYGFASLLSLILRKNGCGPCLCCHASLAAQWARGLWIPPVFFPSLLLHLSLSFSFFLKLASTCSDAEQITKPSQIWNSTRRWCAVLSHWPCSLEKLDAIELAREFSACL